MPWDENAERQVLGTLLVRPDLFLQIGTTVAADDFYPEGHKVIYRAIVEMTQKGEAIDPLRVSQYLTDRSLIAQAGGAETLLQIARDALPSGLIFQHARRVHSFGIRRALIKAAREIQEESVSPQEDESVYLRTIEDKILSITQQTSSTDVAPIGEFRDSFGQHVQHLIQARGGLSGLRTNFREFDRMTSGLKGGELIILAARPSAGKTTLAMNIAANVAIREKKAVLVFSLEMSANQLLGRLMCAESGLNHSDYQRGQMHGKEQTFLAAMNRVFDAPMHLCESGYLELLEAIALTRKLHLQLKGEGKSLGLIVVDYLQLLNDSAARRQSRQLEVASISRALKQLSKQVDAPVLALSQMNRSVESRRGDGGRPQLSDLRESGAIEQDADIVMFIHRELNPDPNDPEAMENRGKAEIILAKHRNGPVGSFRLAFRPEMNRFDDLDPEYNG
ncbi:MAG TPA: replicative DNA helicase [Leptospiraceae bacterium]|nr:replicative DNA helicase [Leptospiraceae bacterium]HMW60505.1 replicative DNA helicase [Leptospiraceae bacterium]HMX56260.1 replicative DNA helicase [Leptospiraceae bacterium]HMZ37086.1 replicative DNA helicase [Leptospiraceae bacterium]HNE24318.1 replicative DNA helicase [Leptospiraceae bacterium]